MVGRSYDKGAEGAGGQFHEMDWDDAPCALDAKLLEESSGDNGMARGEGVWVEKGASNYADEDDRESPSKDLRTVSNHGASEYCTQISHYLCDGNGVGAEFVLVRQHRGVQIL